MLLKDIRKGLSLRKTSVKRRGEQTPEGRRKTLNKQTSRSPPTTPKSTPEASPATSSPTSGSALQSVTEETPDGDNNNTNIEINANEPQKSNLEKSEQTLQDTASS